MATPKCWETQAGVLSGLGCPHNPVTRDHRSNSETFSGSSKSLCSTTRERSSSEVPKPSGDAGKALAPVCLRAMGRTGWPVGGTPCGPVQRETGAVCHACPAATSLLPRVPHHSEALPRPVKRQEGALGSSQPGPSGDLTCLPHSNCTALSDGNSAEVREMDG